MNLTDARSLVQDLKQRVNDAASRAWWLTASESTLVATFHRLADEWLNLAWEVELNPSAAYANGSPKSAVLSELAPRLIGHAQSVEATFQDAGLASAVREFAVGFPAALREVTSGAVGGVTDIVGDAALSLAGPALIIGLGAVALVFLFTKSGGQFRAPGIAVGG